MMVVVQVWKISLQGSVNLSLLMVAAGLVWGQLLDLHPTQTVFISSCLSLSSTPLVSRFLAGGSRGESKEGEIIAGNHGSDVQLETRGICLCL